MSGFDENPFGEPNIDNPFADPAIQQVTTNASSTQKGLEDYNPFADQGNVRPAAVRGATNPPQYQPPPVARPAAASQPAILQPTQEQPPQYTRSGQQQVTNADFQELKRRQEELDRKAEELQRREEELRNAPYNARKNNWPPVPEKCCFQPCFYQDINVDIPLEFQKVVKWLYYLWMFHSCLLVLNVLGGLALLFAGVTGGATTFGMGLLYVFLFTPFSYVCWFRPAYKAFRSDSSFNFMVFFFVFFFQLVVSVTHAIGIPSFGTCGFLAVISWISNAPTPGIVFVVVIGFILACCFAVLALADLFMLFKVHRIYRSTGASFAKAQQEFATGFLRNEHVQSAAANAAAATVRSQMSNRY